MIGIGVGVNRRRFTSGAPPSPTFNGLLISGTFTSPKNKLYAISNSNSTPNATFNTNIGTGLNTSYVWNGIKFNNQLYLGGFFTSYNAVAVSFFMILSTDGTFISGGLGTGFNASVRAIHVQNDGKIICAGQFTSYNGVSVNRVVRLNADLTIDGTFNVGVGFNSGEVNSFASDGTHLYMVGSFTTYKGVTRNRFVKIRISNGDDDTGVNSGFDGINTFGVVVSGDFLFMGGDNFTTFNGIAVPNRLCKVNKNTLALDSTFTTNMGTGANLRVQYSMSADNNFVYINGNFTNLNGVNLPSGVGRFSLSGVVDSSFVFVTSATNTLFSGLFKNKTKFAICSSFTNLTGNPNYNRFAVIDIQTKTIDGAYAVNFTPGASASFIEF